jgi:hypothetical protein
MECYKNNMDKNKNFKEYILNKYNEIGKQKVQKVKKIIFLKIKV